LIDGRFISIAALALQSPSAHKARAGIIVGITRQASWTNPRQVRGMVFPVDEKAALPLDPGQEALGPPAPRVAVQTSPVLRGGLAPVGSVRRDHLDAVSAQLFVERIAVFSTLRRSCQNGSRATISPMPLIVMGELIEVRSPPRKRA
jgi:hypothetical protein